MRLKPLLPSLKEKKRYLAFEAVSEHDIGFSDALRAINSSVFSFMGMLEAGRAGIMPLREKWSQEKKRGIIKVGHRHLDMLRASLLFIDRIGERPGMVRSLGASGMLNKAFSGYIED